MTIQVNDVYGSDKHTAKISKDSPSSCVFGNFAKLMTGFVNDATDTEKAQEIVLDINKLQIKPDGVLKVKYPEIRGCLQLSLMPSDTSVKQETEAIPEDNYTSVDFHTAGYYLARGNKSESPAQILISSESTEIMLQEVNTLVDLEKPKSFRLPVSVNYFHENLYAKPIDSDDLHLIQPSISDGKDNIVSDAVKDLITSELKVTNEKEQSGKQAHYISGGNSSGDIVSESMTQLGSVENLAGEFNRSKAFQQERHNVLDYVDSSSLQNIDAQLKYSSDGSSDTKSIALGEMSKQSAEVINVVPKGFSDKAAVLSLGYERAGLLMPNEIKSQKEEILTHETEKPEKVPIGLKQVFEPSFTQARQDSGFETSHGNVKGEQLLEQGSTERPENSFRNVLTQIATSAELVSHMSDSVEKLTVKTDVLLQLAEKLTFMSTEGKTEMEVLLHPESLGKLLLRVVSENGVYSARITAETYQAKELLQSHLNDLKSTLKEQGFNFLNLDVSLSNGQSNNRQWAWRDSFFLRQNGNGDINHTKREHLIERVGKSLSGSKLSGRIDCLV